MKKYAIALLALALMACSKSNEVSPLESPLVGKWTWVSSGSTQTGYETPTSTGRTMEIEFGSDYVFREYVNGKQNYQMPFKLVRQTIDGKSYEMVEFGEESKTLPQSCVASSWQEKYTLDNTTLTIGLPCENCYTRVFQRQQQAR